MVWGRCLKIRDVCMDFEPYFKVQTWSLFTLKASYLVKWSISTWPFMWWCQFIDWLKFETRPTSLLNFGTAYSLARKATIKVFTFPSICSICKKTVSQFTGKFDRFVLKNKSAIPRLAACESNFFWTKPKQHFVGYLFLVTQHTLRKSITFALGIKLLLFSLTFTAIFVVCPPNKMAPETVKRFTCCRSCSSTLLV